MNSKYIYTNGMDSISLIEYYQTLRYKLSRIVYNMRNAVKVFSDIDSSLYKYYSLDDNSVDIVSIESIYKTLNDRISYLSNTVIPAIDIKIRRINAEANKV